MWTASVANRCDVLHVCSHEWTSSATDLRQTIQYTAWLGLLLYTGVCIVWWYSCSNTPHQLITRFRGWFRREKSSNWAGLQRRARAAQPCHRGSQTQPPMLRSFYFPVRISRVGIHTHPHYFLKGLPVRVSYGNCKVIFCLFRIPITSGATVHHQYTVLGRDPKNTHGWHRVGVVMSQYKVTDLLKTLLHMSCTCHCKHKLVGLVGFDKWMGCCPNAGPASTGQLFVLLLSESALPNSVSGSSSPSMCIWHVPKTKLLPINLTNVLSWNQPFYLIATFSS